MPRGRNVARTVNTTQVVANWPSVIEAEQGGKKRAGYATRLLADISKRLTAEFGREWSVDNLEAFRQFCLRHPGIRVGPGAQVRTRNDTFVADHVVTFDVSGDDAGW
jgi:hypothetical protein